MSAPIEATITSRFERPRDRFDDPSRGNVTWFTLISGDITPTTSLCAGIAGLEPRKGVLQLHRHDPAEIYFIVEGKGIVTIDGVEIEVAAGATVFIPGNAEHGIRNESDALLRLFYVFPTDSFAEVVYRFSEERTESPDAASM